MRKRAQLGQGTPPTTAAVSLFSPSKRDRYTIENIIVCNTTTSAATFRIFCDNDGSTYDTTTAIIYDSVVAANSTTVLEFRLYMTDPAGNLGASSGTGGALTFTVNGDDGSI